MQQLERESAVEWDKDAQMRHAAICIWPSLSDGRADETLRVSERLHLLGYNGCIGSLSADSILQGWRKAGWIVVSPNQSEMRLTKQGTEQLTHWQEQDRLWRSGESRLARQPDAGQVTTNLSEAYQKTGNSTANRNEVQMKNGKDPVSLIHSLLDDLSKLPHRDSNKVDALQKRAKLVITKLFDSSSPYLKDLDSVHFYPAVYWESMGEEPYEQSWATGKAQFTNLCNTMLEDLELSGPAASLQTVNTISTKVFVVHGHDNEMKEAVARTLEHFGLEPIILHEQPDGGRTIIEKFVSYSDVGFAVILLSPDDMGYPKTAGPKSARPRARQNVVLELGFFLGKLGRERVLALHKNIPNFEMPSDYAGVLYKKFDDSGSWRLELARELKALKYEIQASDLL